MSRVKRARLAFALCAGLVGLLCVYSPASTSLGSPSNEPAKGHGVKVLFPLDRCVLLSGDFDVICKTEQGALEVDGEQYEWEPFEPPLRVSHVSLYPGRNKLRIGARELEIFVAGNADQPGGPEGWQVWRNHPISGHGAKRCTACHETEQRSERISVGELKSYKACFECHRSVEFEAIHSHPLEPIEHCQMCHSLHGSTRKALLKAPIKKLCADCHDS